MKSLQISAEDLLDHYECLVGHDQQISINRVMWLVIYDGLSVSKTRELLENSGVFTKPENNKALSSQLQKVRRWRNEAEKSLGLPARERKGTSPEYLQALVEWKRINRRPTNEDLLSGWAPLVLPTNPSQTVELDEKSAGLFMKIDPPLQSAVVMNKRVGDAELNDEAQSLRDNIRMSVDNDTTHVPKEYFSDQEGLGNISALLDADDEEQNRLHS